MTEIRPLQEADRAGWDPLWQAYLRFYRAELADDVSGRTFERLCRGDDGMFAFVAAADSGLVGLVHALVHPSTWTDAGYCYLEDLYVAPAARGTSAARDLIVAVADEAARRGAEKVYWHTNEFNGPARSLYDQVAHLTSFVMYERRTTRRPPA